MKIGLLVKTLCNDLTLISVCMIYTLLQFFRKKNLEAGAIWDSQQHYLLLSPCLPFDRRGGYAQLSRLDFVSTLLFSGLHSMCYEIGQCQERHFFQQLSHTDHTGSPGKWKSRVGSSHILASPLQGGQNSIWFKLFSWQLPGLSRFAVSLCFTLCVE